MNRISKFLFVLLSAFAFFTNLYSTCNAATELTEENINNISFLHRHDVREFYKGMKPVFDAYESTLSAQPNAYIICLKTMFFGTVFGVMDRQAMDDQFQSALPKIITRNDSRKYWLVMNGLRENMIFSHGHYLTEIQKTTALKEYQQLYQNAGFETAINTMHGNIFAYFWKGLMEYENEQLISSIHNTNLITTKHSTVRPITGLDLMYYAAEGYCDPALKLFKCIQNVKSLEKKLDLYQESKKEISLREFLRYAIENDMLGAQNSISNKNTSLINNAEKLASSLVIDGQPFSSFYKDLHKHLFKNVGTTMRWAYFSTNSKLWLFSTVLYPLAVACTSGYEFIDACVHAHTHKSSVIMAAMTSNGFYYFAASLVALSLNSYLWYNRPSFTTFSEVERSGELILVSLFLANKYFGHTTQHAEAHAEKAFNALYKTPAGLGLSKRTKLSKVILDKEER